MSNLIRQAASITGFDETVIAYLYNEFTEEGQEGEDFFEYLADQVGLAAFVLAAAGGGDLDDCIEAYDEGVAVTLTFDSEETEK
jgi:hypothetical protein